MTWAKFPGADDRFVHGTSNDGFANPNPASLLTDRGSTGYFTDVGPGDYGGLIDLNLGTLDVNQSRTFTFYYGISTSESAAFNALQSVGAEVYSLGQPETETGATLGSPITAIFGIDGTGLRGSPTAARAANGPMPDGGNHAQPIWASTIGGGDQR